jgi:hypothetical protein
MTIKRRLLKTGKETALERARHRCADAPGERLFALGYETRRRALKK